MRRPTATAPTSAAVITPTVTSAPIPIQRTITGCSLRQRAARTAAMEGGTNE